MSQKCTVQTVREILYEKAGLPLDTPRIESATWEELGVESLGLSETITSLEISLEVTLPFDDALHTSNVQELVSLINQHV